MWVTLTKSNNIKLLLCGNPYVGKTSLLQVFLNSTSSTLPTLINPIQLTTQEYKPTIGVNRFMRKIDISNQVIKLELWDTAGNNIFRTMVSSYYKNVDGIMIVFDYGNVKSYYDIKRWLKEINMFISDEEEQENVVIYLIGNKVDLQNEGNKAYMGIDEKDMKVFANNNGVKLYNVSALRNVGVYQVFRKIVEDVLKVREKKSKLNKCMLLNGNMGLGKGGAMLMERESTFKEDEMGKGVSMEIENYNNNTNNMNSSSNNNSMCVIN